MWDGTDAVMLSGEAATGKFPCEAVMAEASATREAEKGLPGLASELCRRVVDLECLRSDDVQLVL